MSRQFDVLIVGAGHAGSQAAIALRQRRFTGSIALCSAESELPYERPPLSKDFLSGEKDFARLLLRPSAFWTERRISLLLGRRVVAVDPEAQEVKTEDGTCLEYGCLIWAAGGRPRQLSCPGHDLAGVHSIRTVDDVRRLQTELRAGHRVVVIGAGYIGLEAASVLSKLGKEVTVLEAQDRVLARVTGVELSRFYEAEHRARGVRVHLNAEVTCIEGRNGRVSGVRLASGETAVADIIVVGIGILPEVEPLTSAGAVGGNGVQVDAYCRTSLPDVFAIGDCALHESRFLPGGSIRLESVQNANDMAMTVAKAVTGEPEAYRAVPWFWSNQYDLRLQTVGLSSGYDTAVIRGEMATRSFSIVYLRGRRVAALDCVNAARDFIQGRALVERQSAADPDALANVSVPLKSSSG